MALALGLRFELRISTLRILRAGGCLQWCAHHWRGARAATVTRVEVLLGALILMATIVSTSLTSPRGERMTVPAIRPGGFLVTTLRGNLGSLAGALLVKPQNVSLRDREPIQ